MMSNLYTAGGSAKFFFPATFPKKVIFGIGEANQVGKEAKSLGEKVLVITDQGVTKAGLTDTINKSLQSEKLNVAVYDKVEPEPYASQGDECARLAREEQYDVVIGLGGGSSIDIAKATSIMATNEGELLDYSAVQWSVPKKGLPLILMPTTAGTGSEMSPGIAVRVDEFSSSKRLVVTLFNHPEVVIVDPLLTISMPRDLTANTGIDALAHAIEAYIAVKRHPLTDVLAPEAIRLIADNLPVAYAKGSNVEARFNMSLAATMAGVCLGGGITSIHYLAGTFDSKYGLPHGRAVAIMLAHMMPHFMAGKPDKFARIAQIMGENIEGLPILEAAAKCVVPVKRLLSILNISIKLTDYGADSNDLTELVQLSLERPPRLHENDPADLTEDDLRAIFSEALGS